MSTHILSGSPAPSGQDAQDADETGDGLASIAHDSTGQRAVATLRVRPRQRPLQHRTAGRLGRMVALGVTLTAALFLATLLIWPMVVWLFALAGINLSNFCI